MTYRDDREALHHRVAQLEQQLEETRREGERQGREEANARAEELERRVVTMRDELARMDAELQAMRGQAPKPKPTTRGLFALGAGVIVAALCSATLTMRSRSVSSAPSSPEPHIVVTAIAPLPPPIPVTVTPARAPVPPPPPPPRETKAKWVATVTRAEGVPLAPGSACTIEATLATRKTNATVPTLVVACGAHKIYHSTDPLNGIAQMESDAREVLGADDDSAFTLSYRDLGTRTGERSQLDLDTRAHQATAFRDTIPRFRVDLAIASATSIPGPSLAGPEQRLRLTGKIREIQSAGLAKVGDACVLRAMPTGKRDDCVADVRCGARLLWPTTAPVRCTYDGARTVDVVSDDDAASLVLDDSTLTLKKRGFATVISLDEP